jgi:lipid-A-disaccharide synthase
MTGNQVRAGDLVFLIAGEPSGDALGARLMAALKRASGGRIRFAGVGGERMEAEGLTSLFPLTDIAVMGFTEVVPRLPLLLRRMRETAEAVRQTAPSAVVTIDAPSFGLRVADRVRHAGLPLIHYVAPQLWAWRPGRARKLANRVDHLLALLPFEPEFFRKLGVNCIYVGHPVLEEALQSVSGTAFRSRHGITADTRLIVALPGSRIGLADRMLPVFVAALEKLAARSGVHVVLPVVTGTEALVRNAVAGWRVPHTIVSSTEEKRQAFAAAAAALTVSGTATMELAVAGVPMVVAYRVSRLTELIARRVIEVPHVAMPNLILGKAAVPELLQADCTPERLAEELERLITDGGAVRQRQDLAEICRRLGLDEMRSTGITPSDRAAKVVLDAIRKGRSYAI